MQHFYLKYETSCCSTHNICATLMWLPIGHTFRIGSARPSGKLDTARWMPLASFPEGCSTLYERNVFYRRAAAAAGQKCSLVSPYSFILRQSVARLMPK